MQELEDTLRLPVAGYPPGHQKNLKRNGNTAGKVEGFPAEDRGEEDDFFDFNTIPRSKVVLPILDDELEDTLRRPAVARPTPASGKTGAWITSDGRRVILARILRMFGFGFSSVLIGVTLATEGLSLVQVSLLLS